MDIQKLIEDLKRSHTTPFNTDLRGRKIIGAVPALLDYIAQLEAERDAAVKWIQEFTEAIDQPCIACKHHTGIGAAKPACSGCGRMGAKSCNWQWRNPARKG